MLNHTGLCGTSTIIFFQTWKSHGKLQKWRQSWNSLGISSFSEKCGHILPFHLLPVCHFNFTVHWKITKLWPIKMRLWSWKSHRNVMEFWSNCRNSESYYCIAQCEQVGICHVFSVLTQWYYNRGLMYVKYTVALWQNVPLMPIIIYLINLFCLMNPWILFRLDTEINHHRSLIWCL